MIHFTAPASLNMEQKDSPFAGGLSQVTGSVLIVRDPDKNNFLLDTICQFLDITVEHITTEDDLITALQMTRPMAVVADLEGNTRDGYDVMMKVATYNRALPILLLTCDDPVLLGAVDAIRELWRLTRVSTLTEAAEVGVLVDFLCQAGRDAGVSRMMRI